MRNHQINLFLFILFSFFSNAQDMSKYTSGWEGKMATPEVFKLKVEIENLGSKNSRFRISNSSTIIDIPLHLGKDSIIITGFEDNYSFEGELSEDGKEVNGFIKSGILLYHINLKASKNKTYSGVWNPLMIGTLKSLNFYLSVENGKGNEYEAYPFFGDNRFTGTWCFDFQKDKDTISFADYKTGLKFIGKLLPQKIELGIYLGKSLITSIDLKKSLDDWKIGEFVTSIIDENLGILQLTELENGISKNSFPNTHSVLVSENGKIIYEKYFDGYTANVPHDMRSASKSISSAIAGIAKDQVLFTSVGQSIFDFLPKKYQKQKDRLNAKIDIKSLLTMSSGLDADDYTRERTPVASENNYQPSDDWLATVLSAPMINRPNTIAEYGSANPFLLGVALDSIVSEPLELFMDKYLFQKLEISNYIIQTDEKGKPYFGGGMYLTPRDMIKFGALYLNKGRYNNEQVISEKWINSSVKKYLPLENVPDKNPYGYLWWHNTYQANRKMVSSIEARGAGGQYIFIVPDLKVVVAITSGNWRNGKTQQPEIIFEEYILPYLDD